MAITFKRTRWAAALLATSVAAMWSGSALAAVAVVPAATTEVVVQGSSGPVFAGGGAANEPTIIGTGSASVAKTYVGNGNGKTVASASVDVSNQALQVNSHAHTSQSGQTFGDLRDTDAYGSSAGADLIYEIAVNGPDSLDVPLILRGELGVSVSGTGVNSGGGATAEYDLAGVTATGGTGHVSIACSFGDPVTGDCDGVGFTTDFTLKSYSAATDGKMAIVILEISAFASAERCGLTCDGLVNASAFADPIVTIDPTWAATHQGYSLAFSPLVGEGTAGGVPEPAGWALMIAGFGGAGAALRRRRAVAAFA